MASVAWSIDDDGEMSYTVALMLKAMGYNTQTFLHPRDAMRTMMAGSTPDLIILDMNMPQVSGLDVVRFIRKYPQWERIAIVMLSVETADIKVDEVLEAGADGYLTKPMTLDELEAAVQSAMLHRDLRGG